MLSGLTLSIVSNRWCGLLSFMFIAIGVIGVIFTIKGLKVLKIFFKGKETFAIAIRTT